MNGGEESKYFARSLLGRYEMGRKVISAYQPHSNGRVERSRQPVVIALQKISPVPRDWSKHLHGVLLADRMITPRSRARALLDPLFGWHTCCQSISQLRGQKSIKWVEVRSTEDRLAAGARQLEAGDEKLLQAAG